MNLRKFWIGAGAITTFVVGVSFVAYATGKFTSEASSIEGIPLDGGNAVPSDTPAAGVNAAPISAGINTGSNGSGVGIGAGTALPASNAKTPTATPAKALTTVQSAPPVELQNFLQTNFASVDSILRIGIPRLLVSFAGLVTLIIFLINAVKFLFGAGNEKATTEAKQGMAFAGIGFAIVIFAYLIVSFAASIFK